MVGDWAFLDHRSDFSLCQEFSVGRSDIRCYRILFSGREALDRGPASAGVGAEALADPARMHIHG